MRKLADITGVDPGWLLSGEDKTLSSKGVAETDAPYCEIDDLSEEELGYIDMLVEIFKGSNEDNRLAIKSNLKAFHKSRNMPEPRIKTGQRHKQGPGRNSKKIANSNGDKQPVYLAGEKMYYSACVLVDVINSFNKESFYEKVIANPFVVYRCIYGMHDL